MKLTLLARKIGTISEMRERASGCSPRARRQDLQTGFGRTSRLNRTNLGQGSAMADMTLGHMRPVHYMTDGALVQFLQLTTR